MLKIPIDYRRLFYIDIETVQGAKKLLQMPEELIHTWQKKCDKEGVEDVKGEFVKTGALYPEYGKVVCVSLGYYGKDLEFNVKAYTGDDEKKLLTEVATALKSLFSQSLGVCGHYIKEFDIPFLIKRMIINGIEVPDFMNTYGKKPWDLTYFVDTYEIWKCGAYKGSAGLETLCAVFNIPTPKDVMDGSLVSTIYWNEVDFNRHHKIGHYCNKDVVATANVMRAFVGLKTIENVQYK